MTSHDTKEKQEDYIASQEHLEDQLIFTTKATIDILMKQPIKDRADLIALYQFIYYTAKWQKDRFASAGNRAKCTNTYIHGAFGWKEQKICRLKKTLIELGLIEQVKDIDPATGRITGWYVRAIYLLRRDTVTRFLEEQEDSQEHEREQESEAAPASVTATPATKEAKPANDQTDAQTARKRQPGGRFVSKPAAKPFSSTPSRLPENHTVENGQPNTTRNLKQNSPKIISIDQIDKDKVGNSDEIRGHVSGQHLHEKRGGGFKDLSMLMEERVQSFRQVTRSSSDAPARTQKAPGNVADVRGEQLQVPTSASRASTLQPPTRGVRVSSARVADYVTEIAHRHNDRRDNANIAQIGGLFERSGFSESGFIDWLIVTEKEIADWQRSHPGQKIANYMAYFYTTLRHRLGLDDS